jgi:hypothetical protein
MSNTEHTKMASQALPAHPKLLVYVHNKLCYNYFILESNI